jgi:T4 superinfection immunity protein
MKRTSVLLAVLMVASMAVKSAYAGTLQTPAPADTQTAPAQDVATPPTPAPTQDMTTPAPPGEEQVFPAPEAATPYVSGPSPEQVNPASVANEEVSTPRVAPIPAHDGSVTPVAASAAAAGIGGSILMILVMIAGVAFFLSLIPTLIAFKRRHKDRKAILVLSLVFGWLPFAWMIGLVWSLTGNVEALKA